MLPGIDCYEVKYFLIKSVKKAMISINLSGNTDLKRRSGIERVYLITTAV